MQTLKALHLRSYIFCFIFEFLIAIGRMISDDINQAKQWIIEAMFGHVTNAINNCNFNCNCNQNQISNINQEFTSMPFQLTLLLRRSSICTALASLLTSASLSRLRAAATVASRIKAAKTIRHKRCRWWWR